jgi:hypothetical protein
MTVVYSVSKKTEYHESSWGIKGGQCVRLTASPPSVSLLSTKCILDMSLHYRSPRPVAGIALLFSPTFSSICVARESFVIGFLSNASVTLTHSSIVWPLVLRTRSCDLYFVVLVTMAVTCWWRGMWTFASSVSDVFATGLVTRSVGSAVAGTADRRGRVRCELGTDAHILGRQGVG